MEPKTYKWISAWFLLTLPVVIWDAFYCLMRYAYNIRTNYVYRLTYVHYQGHAQ